MSKESNAVTGARLGIQLPDDTHLQNERFNSLDSCCRIFFLWNVPKSIEYSELASLDILVKSVGIFWWNQAILCAPENQCRNMQQPNTVFPLSDRQLLETRGEVGSVAIPQGQLVVAIDLFLGDFGRVAVNVLDAMGDDAARQKMGSNVLQDRKFRQTQG